MGGNQAPRGPRSGPGQRTVLLHTSAPNDAGGWGPSGRARGPSRGRTPRALEGSGQHPHRTHPRASGPILPPSARSAVPRPGPPARPDPPRALTPPRGETAPGRGLPRRSPQRPPHLTDGPRGPRAPQLLTGSESAAARAPPTPQARERRGGAGAAPEVALRPAPYAPGAGLPETRPAGARAPAPRPREACGRGYEEAGLRGEALRRRGYGAGRVGPPGRVSPEAPALGMCLLRGDLAPLPLEAQAETTG